MIPTPKVFTPKHNLPRLDSYNRKLPDSYWNVWTKRTVEQLLPHHSWVSAEKLVQLSSELGYRDVDRLARVVKRLEEGADIGCRGRARLSTRVKNSDPAYEYGDRVADELQEGVKSGIMAGPLLEEEIPWSDFTCSPMTVRLKPNGKARIIANLSSPRNEEGPGSVNSGIDSKDFPVSMSSTMKFVRSLCECGVGALICKSDWAAAYKHVSVREEDLKLQVMEFGGRYFVELMLIFGGISSAGIYDDLAKVILGLALLRSGCSARLVQQHLDDVVAVGHPGKETIHNFDKAYREVASEVGVVLAGRDDPDKSFSPCTKGLVLGIMYDTVEFTWAIREDKLARLVDLCQRAASNEDIVVADMLSLQGKLVDIRFLVPGGRYNLSYIQGAANSGMDKGDWLDLGQKCRQQCYWWLLNLQAAAHYNPIVDPRVNISPSALRGWTDAAGGSSERVGGGLGGLFPPKRWVYMPWPAWVNLNKPNSDGVRFARKLTCLELVAVLALMSASPNEIRNRDVEVFVDNSGAVDIYAKGGSTSCWYSYTVSKALYDIAGGLNSRLHLTKVSRYSDTGSLAADILSKANF